MKKLVKDLSIVESEAKRLSKIMDSETRSFSNVIKPYLIRSNPEKYLTCLDSSVLPITKIINIDIAILKKHYSDQIPAQLEEASSMFSGIISDHYDCFRYKEASIGKKLTSHLAKLSNDIDSHIVQPSNIRSPYKKRSRTEVSSDTSIDTICSSLNKMASPPKNSTVAYTITKAPVNSWEHDVTQDNNASQWHSQFHTQCMENYVPMSKKELFVDTQMSIP